MSKKGNLREYAISLGVVLAVSAVCYSFSALIGYRVVALLLLVVVSLLAISFDILPVLLAAALSAFIWDFFFIPPQFNLHVNTTEDTILLVMYFVIAMINGTLTYRIRKAEKVSSLKEERAASVTLYNTVLDSLSHELRTPLAAIIGAADNLQSNEHLTENDKKQLIEEISKASLRLNQQVENLLNISRLKSGHIKPKEDWCDVVELIYNVVHRVEENNPGRKVGINIHPDMPLCRMDAGMLEQVIYNLLNNAATHTQPQSRIDIMAACHADLLKIIIEDNGQGFTNIDHKDIFHKFSRNGTDRPSGSGLGLSIVKGFTEALGGSVVVARGIPEGSKFTLSFPLRIKHTNTGT